MLKVLNISHQKTRLEENLKYADRILLTQKKQYDALSLHMEETKKARHDLRQHLTVVQSFVERDDKDGLLEYIGLYKQSLPSDNMELYSHNYVVNAVVNYYAALAKTQGILFEAELYYPEKCPISDTDITVLLGNLLENAVEACIRQLQVDKFIHLKVKVQNKDTLLILVDNTCAQQVVFSGDTPRSSKREGIGIGITSVRDIAKRYQGVTKFEQKDERFYSFVLLRLNKA